MLTRKIVKPREVDRRILAELLVDCRKPLRKIASAVGVSRQTVAKRVRELHRSGLIKRFTVRLNHKDLGLNLKAYILMRIEPKREVRENLEKKIKEIRQVSYFHYLFGRYDALAEVLVKDSEELTRLLREIHGLKGVKETETLIVEYTVKDSPESPILKILMES